MLKSEGLVLSLVMLAIACSNGSNGSSKDASVADFATSSDFSVATDFSLSDGAPSDLLDPACSAYCTHVVAACVPAYAPVTYANQSECLADCTTQYGWQAGTMSDTSGDSIACRDTYASLASSNPSQASFYCTYAGPSGGNACGQWCDNYCDLALRNCTSPPLFPSLANCLSACSALDDTGMPNAATGNTVQCRIYHLGLAGAPGMAATHCPHGSITSTAGTCQ
jgi:hypothetical protein